MRRLTIGTILLAVIAISGCIETNVKGYTDQAYTDFKIDRIVVRAQNVGLSFQETIETSMVSEFNKSGQQAVSFLKMFPPTRNWTNKDVTKVLMSKNYGSIMYISVTGSNQDSTVVGYSHAGTVSAYGNFTGSSSAVIGHDRNTSTSVKIYSVKSARVMWIGSTHTKAGGSVFMGDKINAESMAKEVLASLGSAGHLRNYKPGNK